MKRADHLRSQVPLDLQAAYDPAGFRVEIATNSRDVLRAAEEAWGHYRPEFACEPIRFRVLVDPEGGLSQIPSHRMQGHLYSIVSDPYNFAHIDLARQFGFFHVSQTTAADHSWLRWFFIESAAYLVLTQRYVVPIHAACIVRGGAGILLSGPSGAGKSTLSYACARAGWTFVSDDATWLLPDQAERLAIGRPRHARFRLAAPEGSIPGIATHPAHAGDVLILLATGLGSVSPPIQDGHASTDTTSTTDTKPVVMVGGVAAQVLFSGLSTFVGVNQINIQLAPGTPAGAAVPIQILMGGLTSTDKTTIAIQ